MEQTFPKVFPKCPLCGSEAGLAKFLAESEKEKGRMRRELNFYITQIGGVVVDPTKDAQIPIGSNVPAYTAFFEVCINCGCMWAARIEAGTARKTPTQPPGGGRPQAPPFSTS